MRGTATRTEEELGVQEARTKVQPARDDRDPPKSTATMAPRPASVPPPRAETSSGSMFVGILLRLILIAAGGIAAWTFLRQ